MTLFAKKGENDLTEGNLFTKIPLFALPLAFTTILQLLYTTVDLLTVLEFGGGTLSMTSIGSNSSLINLIITVFTSIPLGANVAIGNAKGAKNKERAEKVLHTSVIVGLISGILVGIFGYFVSRPLLQLMGTPETYIDRSATYMQIYFLGMPFLMLYNYGSQIMRALGDSKRPFFFLIIAGLVNVGFDFLFVIAFKMDVAGVALATILSEAVSAALTIGSLALNKKAFVSLRWKKLKVDRFSLKEILVIGLPAGIQGLAFCIPNVLIQSSLYTITDYTIDGVAISMNEITSGASASSQVEGYIFALIDAFSASVVAFVGQNYGAKKTNNIRKVFWYATIWQFIIWGIMAYIIGIWPKEVLSLFMKDDENVVLENALNAGKERLYIMGFTYCLDGLMGIFGNYLRGMRHSTTPAIITLVGCTGSRILFLYTLFLLPYFHTIFWLYAAFPISWILVDIVYIPITIVTERKVFKQLNEGKNEEKPNVGITA